MSQLPDLPPPDRFGTWLDSRHRRRPWADPHRFWSGTIAVAIAAPGVLLAKAGGPLLTIVGCLIVLGAMAVFAVLLARYHPAWRARRGSTGRS